MHSFTKKTMPRNTIIDHEFIIYTNILLSITVVHYRTEQFTSHLAEFNASPTQ